jgi:hypothetical protein
MYEHVHEHDHEFEADLMQCTDIACTWSDEMDRSNEERALPSRLESKSSALRLRAAENVVAGEPRLVDDDCHHRSTNRGTNSSARRRTGASEAKAFGPRLR